MQQCLSTFKMASLLAPLPYPKGSRNQPYEFSKPPASRTLLNLDCSADLTSYSRSLGPVVPDRKISITDETVRAHIEDRRDHILRSRESSRGPQVQAQALGYPPSGHPHASVPDNPNIHNPIPRPQPAQFLLQRPLSTAPTPTLSRPRSPIPGNPATYPSALRSALEESSRRAAEPTPSNVVFQVIEQIDSRYMDDSTSIVSTHKTLHSANKFAADHFISEYGGCLDQGFEREPEFGLDRYGGLEMRVETDGSMGGLCSVYVRGSTVRS
jgi:hypothetical protein